MSSYYEKFIATGEVKCIDDEIPFEIPSTWEWCRIYHISNSYIGLTYKPSDISEQGIIVLRSSNIQQGKLSLQDIVRVKSDIPEKLYVQNNDILICARNGSKRLVGKSAIINGIKEPMIFGAFMAICKTSLYEYVYLFLQSDAFFSQLREVSGTTTINQLTQNNFNSFLIPIPPRIEQIRIANKFTELVPYIERYSYSQDNLDLLNKSVGDLLKKSILQEAIQGKLVPQITEEGSAQELLEHIKLEKQKLVKEGKLKKTALIDSIIYKGDDNKYYEQIGNTTTCIDEKIPFEIPANWRWCRLGNLIAISSGINLTSKQMESGKIPVYGGNGITGYHSKANVFEETIVIGRVGYYCGSIHLTPSKAWVTDNAFITQYSKLLNRDFLILLLKVLNLGRCHNATAQPVVSGKKIYPLLVAIPPLTEQHRIVAQIEKLFEQLR